MMEFVFKYTDPKKIHVNPLCGFTDHDNKEFINSNLFIRLKNTTFVQTNNDGIELKSSTLNLDNQSGSVFINLKQDYDYLWKWFHNPYRKSNTRHGWHTMLYINNGDQYIWKLSKTFATVLLTIRDETDSLFDYS